MSNFWKFVILAVASYLLGNITFARLFARTRNDDITTHGSGNPGTMNMLRTHGLWLAIATLLFDALKSAICCTVAYFWLKTQSGYLANLAVYVSGVCCIIGHIYPVIYKFKGGKGVATAFGVTCVARPTLIPLFMVVFLVIFLVWKIGSIASLSAVLMFMLGESIILLVNGYYGSFVLLIVAVSLIFYAHRTNIEKIFNNKESKIDINEAVQKDKDYAREQREKRKKKNKDKTVTKIETQSTNTENVEVEIEEPDIIADNSYKDRDVSNEETKNELDNGNK